MSRLALVLAVLLVGPLLTLPAAVPADAAPGAGEIRTVTPRTPFSLVGLRWTGPTPDVLAVRAFAGQRWSEWVGLEPADGAAGAMASEPLWTGPSSRLQVRALRAGAPADDVTPVFVDPGTARTDAAPRTTMVAGIPVITRSGWGADERMRCMEPDYDDRVAAVTIHHTAGSNDYTRAESARIVRGIYTYHARTLGWCDIGYNALIDRYGQIFEGRAGGLDRAVIGAHAGGFNRRTSGISLIGTYTSLVPPPEQMDALIRLLKWKAGVHGLDPRGSTRLTSEGGGTSRYPRGKEVTVPVIFGHRDVGRTACPGEEMQVRLRWLRDTVAAAPPV